MKPAQAVDLGDFRKVKGKLRLITRVALTLAHCDVRKLHIRPLQYFCQLRHVQSAWQTPRLTTYTCCAPKVPAVISAGQLYKRAFCSWAGQP